MMYTKLWVIAFLFSIMMGLISCSKQEIKSNQKQNDENFTSPVQIKIINFLEHYDQFQNNSIKSEGDSISFSDALWYWDAAFNYTYGFPNLYLENVQQDTIYLPLPNVNQEGYILTDFFYQTYSEIIFKSRTAYNDIDLENKSLNSIQMNRINNQKNDDNGVLEVILNVGSLMSCPIMNFSMPFANSREWEWGNGSIKDLSDSMDATIALTNAIAAYDFPISAVPQGQYLWVYNIRDVEYEPTANPSNWWLFYATAATDTASITINGSALNAFYTTIMTKTHNNGELSLHPTTYQPYYSAEVLAKARPFSNGYELYHALKVRYATQEWVNRNPVALDE